MYNWKLILKIQKTNYDNLKYPRGAFRIQTSKKKIPGESS